MYLKLSIDWGLVVSMTENDSYGEDNSRNSWESDPDAWKKGTEYEKDEPKRIIKNRSLEPKFKMGFVGVGIKPCIEVVICDKKSIDTPAILNRDGLKIVRFVYDGMKITLKDDDETFMYDEPRNLWLKIR